MKERRFEMVEMQLDLEDDLVDKIEAMALEMIKDDREALINYGVNKCLEEVIKTKGKCLTKRKKKK